MKHIGFILSFLLCVAASGQSRVITSDVKKNRYYLPENTVIASFTFEEIMKPDAGSAFNQNNPDLTIDFYHVRKLRKNTTKDIPAEKLNTPGYNH